LKAETMNKTRLFRALSSGILTASLALPVMPVIAGGGPGDVTSREHSGTHFFGEVKDIAGLKPLEGVRVKVAITGTRMFLVVLTDEEGRFRLEGFGRDVPAAKVAVTCDKDGYRVVEATHRQMGKTARAPIGVECLLSRRKS
jgi:hypothetical protein